MFCCCQRGRICTRDFECSKQYNVHDLTSAQMNRIIY